MSTWLTSDSHFGHRAMAATGKGWRPFATVEEHDETLIENWNKVVRPNDEVWHLGDVGFGNEQELLNKVQWLNGEKHLISGNHDPVWSGHFNGFKHHDLWLNFFHSIQTSGRIKTSQSEHFLINHFPYEGDHVGQQRYDQHRPRDLGQWLVHGHVHDAWKVRGRQINVGVDVWDFRPVHLDEITALIRAGKADAA